LSKSIKPKNDTYIDSSGIVHNKKILKEILNYGVIEYGEPVKTGKIINGKEEWLIKLNLGVMPNTGTKDITIPIDLRQKLITREFHIWLLSDHEYGTEPNNGINYFITTGKNLHITTTNDKSRFTGYADLYYIDR